MAIEDVIGGDLDPTNVLLTVPALFVALAMAFFGFQQNNLGLLVAGLTLFLLPVTGLVLTRLELLNSTTPFYWTAAGYVIGTLIFVLPDLITNINLSFSATPSQSYLAAALGETSVAVTSIMNNYLAPRGENMAILGLAVLLLLTARTVTDNTVLISIVTLGPTSLAFALLHGVRSPFFLLLAGGFMTVWIVLYLGDDLGIDAPTELGLATFGATVGLHQGNNISASGGLLEYYSTLLTASEPVIFISYLIILLDVVLFGYVAVKTVEILVTEGPSGLIP
jgi:hypothetical protein